MSELTINHREIETKLNKLQAKYEHIELLNKTKEYNVNVEESPINNNK